MILILNHYNFIILITNVILEPILDPIQDRIPEGPTCILLSTISIPLFFLNKHFYLLDKYFVFPFSFSFSLSRNKLVTTVSIALCQHCN